MQKKFEIEASNYDEAVEKAVSQLHVAKDKIFVNELEDGKFEALLDISLALEAKKYLENILDNIGVDYNIEVRTLNDEQELYVMIDSSENPLLIGIQGRTLDALQALVKNLIGTFTHDKIVVTVDVGGYKENRKRKLESLASKIAREVAQTKQAVKLKPMSSYERLIIHEKLADSKDVFTESEGEGENRAIVVKPKK